MGFYRGKDIGGRNKLIETCQKIIEGANAEEIYEILPHLRIVRSPGFFDPLTHLLESGDQEQKAVAAMALGSLGDPRSVALLLEAFRALPQTNSKVRLPLETAYIAAMGEIPTPKAVKAVAGIAAEPGIETYELKMVVSALGQLAQQEVAGAEEQLLDFFDHPEGSIRAAAVAELCLAYWHQPNSTPDHLIEKIVRIAREDDSRVSQVAEASLANLAQLGCEKAELLFTQWRIQEDD